MNKRTRRRIGLALIVISFIWIIIVTGLLAVYWPVYKLQPKKGIIVWNEPYADFTEPDWF